MKKSLIKYFFKLGLTVFVFGLLVKIVGWEKIGYALLETNPFFFTLVIIGTLCNRMVAAFAMHTLLGFVGLQVHTSRVFLANSLSTLYALIVPGDVVAATAKWANLSAATGRKSMVLNAIIYNRLALLFPALLIGSIALVFDDPFEEPLFKLMALCFLLLSIVVAIFLYHPACSSLTDSILRRIGALFPHAVASRIDMIIVSLNAYRSIPLSRHLQIFVISICAMIARIFVFVMASYTVGIQIPVISLVWIMALLGITRLVPITINNIGVREGILIVILNLYDIAAESAIALGMIMFASNLVFAMIGLGYQVALTMGWAGWHSKNI